MPFHTEKRNPHATGKEEPDEERRNCRRREESDDLAGPRNPTGASGITHPESDRLRPRLRQRTIGEGGSVSQPESRKSNRTARATAGNASTSSERTGTTHPHFMDHSEVEIDVLEMVARELRMYSLRAIHSLRKRPRPAEEGEQFRTFYVESTARSRLASTLQL